MFTIKRFTGISNRFRNCKWRKHLSTSIDKSEITPAEFNNSMKEILKGVMENLEYDNTQYQRVVKSKRIGVALSGGADSTSLTLLLSQWLTSQSRPEKSKTIFPPELICFHVDHKLRPTSTSEANQIKEWFQERYIDVKILTLDWTESTKSKNGQPSESQKELSNSKADDKITSDTPSETTKTTHEETSDQISKPSNLTFKCRVKRYEALEKACVEHGIKMLFVAHNLEDRIETLVERLRRKTGIEGTQKF